MSIGGEFSLTEIRQIIQFWVLSLVADAPNVLSIGGCRMKTETLVLCVGAEFACGLTLSIQATTCSTTLQFWSYLSGPFISWQARPRRQFRGECCWTSGLLARIENDIGVVGVCMSHFPFYFIFRFYFEEQVADGFDYQTEREREQRRHHCQRLQYWPLRYLPHHRSPVTASS